MKMNMLKSLHFYRVWLPPHLLAIGGLLLVNNWRVWATAAVFYCLISGLGVAVGLHRFFSHRSFKTSPFWTQAMLFFGCLACHGNPLFWIALHRGVHHRHSDTEKDVHSPIHGIWHSYQGYAFDPRLVSQVSVRSGVDFMREPSWMWAVNRYHTVLWAAWAIAAVISWFVGLELIVGMALAQVWAIHQEAAVNLLGHTSGFGSYRNHDTKDHSVNRNWLGLFTWGQALHNNHHALASAADFAYKTDAQDKPRHFEFDPSMLWIRIIRTNTGMQ